ncbi:MAG: hypothetical protein DRN95_00185 [Candidatus Hydrothermarchaeota archaeon]|nr:MAG: hypothetical protein DRN95_00185 [Candidatus Hydrothermarchaeota archaeon]
MKRGFLFVVFISFILIGAVNAETCKPFCDKIGTRSEGWYDSCTGRLIKYDSCSRCEAICKEIGTRNEGWYSSCDNSLILLTSCEESSSAYTGSEASSIVVENPLTCTDTDGNNIYIKGTTTGWDYYKRTRISNTDSCAEYDGGAPTDSGEWVIEEECDEEGRVLSHYYKCPTGYWCRNGRCVLNESAFDCPDYCKDNWHYYGGKFNAEKQECEYTGRRFCKYGCDEEGKTCKIPEDVSCPDYCKDGILWKDGSFNRWTLECDYKYKIVCSQGCNEEGTSCKEYEKEKENKEDTEYSCEERMRKVIEETCINQGVDAEICEERYKNLVEFECDKKEKVEKAVIELTICQSLRNRLISLSEELMKAETDEEKYKIRSEISKIKEEYEKCIIKPEETENVKVDICDELESLKESYNNLLEKGKRIRELILEGKTDKSSLEEIEKEILFLKERIKKAETACKEKKEYQESPCLMLSTMMKIEKELNEKISSSPEEAEKLKERLEEVRRKIVQLREECAKQRLSDEKVSSLIEAEEVYKSKVQGIIEESSSEDIEEKLSQIKEEKHELIENVVKNLSEINLTTTEIIEKVKISGKEIYLDDIKIENKPVRIRVEDRELYVKLGEEVIIEDNGIVAKGNVNLIYENNTLIAMNSKKPIKILPSEVSENIKGAREIRLVDEDIPKYKVSAERTGKILGLIPVSFEAEYEISAESGELLGKTKPWWTALVFGESNPMPSP